VDDAPSLGPPLTGPSATAEPIWERPPRPVALRALNAAGAGLRRLGVRWPRLDPEALEAAARRRTGLSDFGDPSYREGLNVLVAAFEARDDVHAFGRVYFREVCVAALANRLKIQRDLTRHPEILDVPVPRPLFVTGLPRSGTTFLHRLLSSDPAGRTMLFWEALAPSPPPETATYATDPRIAKVRRSLALVKRLAPRLSAAHQFAADIPEEDNNLFVHGFLAGIFGFQFDVPAYVEWMRPLDLTDAYRYMRRQLQLLSWKHRGSHWVLKAPTHMYGLDALLRVFPDASVVVTHRDPLKVVPSVSSLAAGFRGILTDRVDRRRLGDEFTQVLAAGTERMIDSRAAAADPSRFFDVHYADLVADPISTCRDIYAHFGYEFTPEFEAAARRHLAENPQHKHGVHRYCLDDFGLDPAAVEAKFTRYREWLAALPRSG